MYKSHLLSHLARAGRSYQFFTSNLNSANATALSFVKPKVGIGADKSFFSSWGSSHNASNANPSVFSQSSLAAISSNDDNYLESDRTLRRKALTFRAPRRYSTGTKPRIAEDVAEVRQIEEAAFPQNPRDLNAYTRYIDELEPKLAESTSVQDFERFFDALNHVDQKSFSDYDAPNKSISRLLLCLNRMLQNDIAISSSAFHTMLQMLLRHRSDVTKLENALQSMSIDPDGDQPRFLKTFRQRLNAAREEDAASSAIKVFKLSLPVQPKYEAVLLDHLLHACKLTKNAEAALQISDYFDATKTQKTPSTYKLLIEVFTTVGDMTAAVECFNAWKSAVAILPGHDHFMIYLALVQAFVACGKIDAGIEFFNNAVEQYGVGVRRKYALSVVITLANGGYFENARKFLEAEPKETKDRGLTYIVKAAASSNNVVEARAAFREIKSLSEFNEVQYALWTYMTCLVTNGYLDEVLELIRQAVKYEMTLRSALLSSIMSYFVRAGRINDAIEVFGYCSQDRLRLGNRDSTKSRASDLVERFITDLGPSHLDKEHLPKVLLVCRAMSHKVSTATFVTLAEALIKEGGDASSVNDLCFLCNESDPIQQRSHHINDPSMEERFVVCLEQLSGVISKLDPSTLPDLIYFSDACHRHGIVGHTSKSDLLMLPASRAIFLSETDPKIDRFMNADLLRRLDNRQSPFAAIRQAVDESRAVTGNACLRAITYISRAGSRQDLFEATPLLETLIGRVSVSSGAQAVLYNTLIIAYNEVLDETSAQMYLEKVISLGYLPNAPAYASFVAKMDTTKYKDSASRAVELLNQARTLGVVPNEFLFNTVIAKLAKARRNDEALALFNEMKTLGCQPNGVTYGTVINSCCRVGLTDRAEALFRELEQLPLSHQNRIAPYNTLMQHFIQVHKDRAKAMFYWNKLSLMPIRPTAHSYRLLIESHGHLEPVDPAAAESVIGMMRANRVPVESVHHAAMIHMYGIALKDLPSAVRYFNSLGGRHDDVSYQAMLEAHVQHGDIEGMKALLDRMSRSNVKPNAYITNLAIQGYSQSHDIDQARALFDSLPSQAGAQGKEPSTYETMIRLYEQHNQHDRSAEILDMLRNQSYPEAIVHHAEALISRAA